MKERTLEKIKDIGNPIQSRRKTTFMNHSENGLSYYSRQSSFLPF